MSFHKGLFLVLVAIWATHSFSANEDPVLTGEIYAEDAEDSTKTTGSTADGSVAGSESEPTGQDSNATPKGEIYAIAEEIEWRERVKGGICGVFNPETVEIEWMEQNKGGVAGVYNPLTKEIEWRQKLYSGVAGFFNPATEEIEWKENYKGGIAAVYNPSTGQIEWNQIYKGDVAGVYNPVTRQIEWRQKGKTGIAGVFNPDTEKIEWREKYQVGMAGILAGQPASLSCSSYAIDYKRRRSTGSL
jgi:hypothetical protein